MKRTEKRDIIKWVFTYLGKATFLLYEVLYRNRKPGKKRIYDQSPEE